MRCHFNIQVHTFPLADTLTVKFRTGFISAIIACVKIFSENDVEKISAALLEDQIGAMPTDTVFGLLGSAKSSAVVERIYEIKKRDSHKPFIILISAVEEISQFGIAVSPCEKVFLNKLWPDKVSVVLLNPNDKFEYLHRGEASLAFRIPTSDYLVSVIKRTGPLVAPSANAQGEGVIRRSNDALEKFKDEIDFVVKESTPGEEGMLPSTLIKLNEEGFQVLREGRVSEAYIKEIWEGAGII